jgi:pectate lyase
VDGLQRWNPETGQTTPAGKRWLGFGPGGTTGGSDAADENIFTINNRAELVKALQANGTPGEAKIILVKGTINLCVDDNNNELFEKDYTDPGYNFEDYVEAYKPSIWNVKLESNGRPLRSLTGPLEEARKKSAEKQKKRILIEVTSNTSIIGIGKDAKIIKGNLFIGNGTENVIIRNITFEDSFDYFPVWDPGDSYKIRPEYPGAQAEYIDEKTGPQKATL